MAGAQGTGAGWNGSMTLIIALALFVAASIVYIAYLAIRQWLHQ